MATVLKTPPFQAPAVSQPRTNSYTLNSANPFCLSFRRQYKGTITKLSSWTNSIRFASAPSVRYVQFAPFASTGEAETTNTEGEVQESQIEDSSDGAIGIEDAVDDDTNDTEEAPDVDEVPVSEEAPSSMIVALLQSYKEALANNDDSRVSEVEAFLKSVEQEKLDLESKVAKLSEELSVEKDRILRISADFDNFRKRTERDRLSLVENAQGEVVEKLLSVVDNFERAKIQIKVETEGEEKINNSYQSIYKQLVEILGSLGVVPVETIGKPFDPLLHEAIMREDSTEYEEGVVLEEFRKGFKLGDRLLRPSMVKVSAGPGPAKPEDGQPAEEGGEAAATESSGAEVEADSA